MSLLFLTGLFFKTFNYLIQYSIKSSKRGVSEIVGTMVLLAVTVTGGLIVAVAVQENDSITGFITSEPESIDPNVIPKVKISGYDTRDAADLYGISGLSNLTGPTTSVDSLCTVTTCANSGADTEFIVLRVRNDVDIPVEITSISINEIEHTFDTDHSGTSLFSTSTTLPEQGEFAIISGFGISGLKLEQNSILPQASEKRLVIRLSTSITTDIALNDNIRVIINTSASTTQLLLVPAGSNI